MILYVNGEDFSAGACAVNDFSFANDDFKYVALGLKPHPDNLAASYGIHLSKMLALALVCEAEAQSSNQRIIDTTYNYINNISPKQHTLVVIGWNAIGRKNLKDHESIFQLHNDLIKNKMPHLFFNAVDNFTLIPENQRKNWGISFINPYSETAIGHTHLNWAQRLFKHLTINNISV
jgi:hypothetical protein